MGVVGECVTNSLPNKLDDLPGCAVREGSVGGHIKCKVNTFNSNLQRLFYYSIIDAA